MKKKPAKKRQVRRVRVRRAFKDDSEWKKQHDEFHAKQEAQALEQMKLVERFVVSFERIATAEEKLADTREKQDTRIKEYIAKFEKQMPDLLASLVTGSKPKENPS